MTIEQQVDRIGQNHAFGQGDNRDLVERLRSKGDFEQEARALEGIVSEISLDLGVHLRHPSSTSVLADSKEHIAWYGDRFVRAVESADRRAVKAPKPLFASLFADMITATLAAGHVDLATRMAQVERLPVVSENLAAGGADSADLDDVLAHLLAATVRDDRMEFDRQLPRWKRLTEGMWFYNEYYPYPEIMHSILRRDAKEIDRLLARADALFRARIEDKRIEGEVTTGDDWALSVDLEAVALAKLARHRGFGSTFSSETIPS